MTYPKYYISTGDLAVYYTLRCVSLEHNSRLQPYEKDSYLGRLSTDKETALAKAEAQLGFVPEIRSAPTNELKRAKARTEEEIEAASYFMPNGKFAGQDLRDLIAQGDGTYLEWWLNNYRRNEDKARTADKIAIALFSETLERYNARLEAEAKAKRDKETAGQKAKALEFWPLLARLRNDWRSMTLWERGFVNSVLFRMGLRIPFELELPGRGLVSFSDFDGKDPVAQEWSSLDQLTSPQFKTLERILRLDLEELVSVQPSTLTK